MEIILLPVLIIIEKTYIKRIKREASSNKANLVLVRSL